VCTDLPQPDSAPDRANARADTRTRLLEAAGETFAELGYRATTVREICRRAGANIAAINYHFGDKERLYEAVLTYTAEQSMKRIPIGGEADPGAGPAERLESFIRGYIERMLNEGRPAWFGKLVAREMFEPTEALDKVAKNFATPQYQRLRAIVGELLGPGASDALVRWCAFSVIGQCLFYKHARPVVERLAPEQGYAPADRAELARHIAAFSLAAMRNLRSPGPGPAAERGVPQ
jgi:AcrR family transcriptional regulator